MGCWKSVVVVVVTFLVLKGAKRGSLFRKRRRTGKAGIRCWWCGKRVRGEGLPTSKGGPGAEKGTTIDERSLVSTLHRRRTTRKAASTGTSAAPEGTPGGKRGSLQHASDSVDRFFLVWYTPTVEHGAGPVDLGQDTSY
ncbi:hypothetical protein V8F33_002485 [Rhypophila sp. PSN 637]